MKKKRTKHYGRINWTRNTYMENGKKYVSVHGYDRSTGKTVKSFKFRTRA